MKRMYPLILIQIVLISVYASIFRRSRTAKTFAVRCAGLFYSYIPLILELYIGTSKTWVGVNALLRPAPA